MAGKHFDSRVFWAVMAIFGGISVPAMMACASQLDSHFFPGFVLGLCAVLLRTKYRAMEEAAQNKEAGEEEDKDGLTAPEEEFRTDRTMYR